ncbi:hypothetical protein UFOVP1640_14 [uncultured Caudovirales phage]|uniref:Uncharacterized protein n=1 Tax=uncultured Caudovirales phage TaxID=2100421 RepID=A0A6J5RNZ8_9CAUD|nr:hypothetical protein UFOVP1286_17 [uncultured Caudovirales phage]CAB4205556.1 hypothetical protein UFOVP1407_47 [uncultured Caudovirales phage]CAB4221613.1 hypothetical protein UFOVP1640_14 [uncultured Caudovirales phage]
MYKLLRIYGEINSVRNLDTGACIPFDPDNADYENFKAQINDESAQLEDADGVLMTPDEAKAYVATLP